MLLKSLINGKFLKRSIVLFIFTLLISNLATFYISKEMYSLESDKNKIDSIKVEQDNNSSEQDIIKPALNYQEEIKERVKYISNNFKTGMTEEEVLELINVYGYEKILNESEDGTYYDIKFEEFTFPPFAQELRGYEIDITNIEKGNIGLQISVGMTREKIAKRLSLVYLENNQVVMNFTSDGQNYISPIGN